MRMVIPCLLALSALAPTVAQDASPTGSGKEIAVVPLFKTQEHSFRGPLPSAEFFFRLPEHIKLEEGSQLILNFRASPLLVADVSTATIELNGRPITSLRLPGESAEEGTGPGMQTVTVPVRTDQLKTGWNVVAVKCLMQTTYIHCRDVDNPACWFLLENGTGLRVAYARTLLFPELARFPDSLAEEQLLHQEQLVDAVPEKDVRPVLDVLTPENLSDSALRGMLVAVSRLGQPGYLRRNSIRLGRVADWNRGSGQRNGVIVGVREDLAALDLPAETRMAMDALQDAEGLLSEIVTGEPGGMQRRWIVASGADAEGLEKAVLALGSADSLGSAPPSPWTVRETPGIAETTAQLAHPLPYEQTFDNIHGGPLLMRGVFRSRASLPWTFPPGYETTDGAEVFLEMSHAGGLSQESAVQMELNDVLLQGIPLEHREEKRTVVKLAVPAGIVGRDPGRLIVSAYLDIGSTDCSHRNEERAWVNFGGDSFLDIPARPLRIDSLDRLGLVLLRDAFLRRAAILLPENPSEDDLGVVRDIALFLGKSLPSMPILWPEAAMYSADRPADAARLDGRSIVLLGSAAQWREALPAGTPLSISAEPGANGAVRMQGRSIPAAQLTSSLIFAQYLASPWSSDNCVIAVGGIDGYGSETTARLLTSPDVQPRIAGTAAGLDAEGRVFSYDVRKTEDQSLVERVEGHVPKGQTLRETQKKIERDEKLRGYLSTRNIAIAAVALVMIAIMIRTQVVLRSRMKKRRREENRGDDSGNS